MPEEECGAGQAGDRKMTAGPCLAVCFPPLALRLRETDSKARFVISLTRQGRAEKTPVTVTGPSSYAMLPLSTNGRPQAQNATLQQAAARI